MAASRVWMLRPSLRAACRRPVASPSIRPRGQRGYATIQERVAKSSDRPWQIAALAVTIPGIIYLQRSGTPDAMASGGHHGTLAGPKEQQHSEPKEEAPEPQVESKAESPAEPEQEEASEAKAEAAESDSSSSSDSEGAPTPSGPSEAESPELDDSHEMQALKSPEKPSQPTEPTEK